LVNDFCPATSTFQNSDSDVRIVNTLRSGWTTKETVVE
jgi:hypothetical protein